MAYQEAPDFSSADATVLAVARCEWLDTFAELEVEVLRCATRTGGACDGKRSPLSHRLRTLEATPVSPRLSRSDGAELKKLIAECDRLLPLRAAVVHSKMVIGHDGCSPAAIFHNAFDVAQDSPVRIVLTAADLHALRSTVQQLARGFRSISSKASSPRPPGPGAAGGP